MSSRMSNGDEHGRAKAIPGTEGNDKGGDTRRNRSKGKAQETGKKKSSSTGERSGRDDAYTRSDNRIEGFQLDFFSKKETPVYFKRGNSKGSRKREG